jgi:hypothetical protein
MIPMVGFGIMDNLIMIIAGDAIDTAFHARFGIATLTAAAFGQVLSDMSGVMFGGVVERTFSKMGLRAPSLTAAQRRLSVCKNIIVGGSVFGVMIGCLMVSCTLLFMDLRKEKKGVLLKAAGEGGEKEGEVVAGGGTIDQEESSDQKAVRLEGELKASKKRSKALFDELNELKKINN